MANIGFMTKKLIGINCISGQAGVLLQKAWERRFYGEEKNAVLIHADTDGEIRDVIEQLIQEFRQRGIDSFYNNFYLAVFSDVTETSNEFMVKLRSLKTEIRNTLGCTVEEQCNFIHLGAFSLKNAQEKVEIKENLRKNLPDSNRVMLVGRRPLTQDDELWRAELALLDIICRGATNVIHANYGFLGYGDSRLAEHKKLQARKEFLTAVLHGDSVDPLKKAVSEFLHNNILNIIDEQCMPEAGMIPVHVNMYVEKSLMNHKRKKAENRKNSDYEEAVQFTEEAVRETILKMKDYVQDIVETALVDSNELFEQLIAKYYTGLALLRDQDRMNGILGGPVSQIEPVAVSLHGLFETHDIQQEIYKMLRGHKDFEKNEAERYFYQKLREAYNQITADEWKKRQREYSIELNNIEQQLSNIPDIHNFCENIMNESTDHFRKAFQPTIAGEWSQERFYLLYSSELQNVLTGNNPNVTMVQYDENRTGYSGAEALSVFTYDDVEEHFDMIMTDLLKM